MSDPGIAGPLSALVVPITDAVRENRSNPAHIQADNTAYCGGLLLGVAGRVALTFGSEASSFPREYLLSHGQSETEQRSFDATCRKLFRFLTAPRSAAAATLEARPRRRTDRVIDGDPHGRATIGRAVR